MGTFIQDDQEYINFPSSSKETCNLQENGGRRKPTDTSDCGSEGRHFIGMDHSRSDHLISVCVHISSLSCK